MLKYTSYEKKVGRILIDIIDNTVYNFLSSLQNLTLNNVMIIITSFASAASLILITVYLFLFTKTRKDAKYVAMNLVIVFLITQILKNIFARPRPSVLHLVEESGYSFPSAHAMVGFGFYAFCIYLIYKKVENKKLKWFSIIGLSLLIFFIGISRVYLGVHHFTDIIGGFAFAAIYISIFIKFIYKKGVLDK